MFVLPRISAAAASTGLRIFLEKLRVPRRRNASGPACRRHFAQQGLGCHGHRRPAKVVFFLERLKKPILASSEPSSGIGTFSIFPEVPRRSCRDPSRSRCWRRLGRAPDPLRSGTGGAGPWPASRQLVEFGQGRCGLRHFIERERWRISPSVSRSSGRAAGHDGGDLLRVSRCGRPNRRDLADVRR